MRGHRDGRGEPHPWNEWDERGDDDAPFGESAEYHARSRSHHEQRDYPGSYYDSYDEDDEYRDEYSEADYGQSDEYSAKYLDIGDRALIAPPEHVAPTPYAELEMGPVLIPGTGVSMGIPFIARRARPLTMRLATFILIVSVIVTGLVSVTPLGAATQPGVSSFEALSGAVVLGGRSDYFWYTARLNDTIEQLAKNFHVQIGGILEMNGLCPSQGLEIGKPYKIPTNSQYGADYASHVPSSCASSGALAGYGYYGQTVFGTTWWNSYAGIPTEEGRCADAYGPNYLDFKFTSPNWNSNWVRGFTFFHDGDDIAAPQGNPIHAVQAGQIIWAGYDATNGFGWSVIINHCYHVSSLYGHMIGLAPGIKAGVNVSQGQVLGYEGMTGWATGPHCHLSIDWNNVPIDPMLFYRSIYDLTHYVPNP